MSATELTAVFAFLECYPGVEERASAFLSEEDELNLRKLAVGQLEADLREGLIPLLRKNPTALQLLGDEIKRLRASQNAAS